jgi:ABC-type polysaccharide/polyol phosphate export permease
MKTHSLHALSWRQYANLVRVLARRDLRAMLSRTVLGYAWTVALPITYVMVFSFYRLIFGISLEGGVPYVPFTFAGIMLWMLFSAIVAGSYQSIASNASVLKKMDTPREVFFATAFVVPSINFGVSLIFFLLICAFFGVFGWGILWLPVALALVYLLAAGIGMLMVAVGVYRHDVVVAVPIVLQVWMLMTPIFYPVELIPASVRWLVYLNPMAGIVATFREPFFLGTPVNLAILLPTALGTFLVGAIGYYLFRRTGRYLADIM